VLDLFFSKDDPYHGEDKDYAAEIDKIQVLTFGECENCGKIVFDCVCQRNQRERDYEKNQWKVSLIDPFSQDDQTVF